MPITIICDELYRAPENSIPQFQVIPPEDLCRFTIEQNSLICKLTRKPLINPVVASDGYTYEREEIQKWFTAQPNKNYLPSPVRGCNTILEIDNQQNLILINNLLIKNLLNLKGDASIDLSNSGFIDIISFNLIKTPIICPDNNTYDLHSEAQWLSDHQRHSLSRAPISYIFRNHLVAELLSNFHKQNQRLQKVCVINARIFFSLIKKQHLNTAQNLLRNNPSLATQAINEDGAQIIHLLALMGNISLIEFLVQEFKVDLKTRDNNGACALYYAIMGQHSQALFTYWQAKGLDLNIQGQVKNPNNGLNENTDLDALLVAVLFENTNAIKQLFASGFTIRSNESYIKIVSSMLALAKFEIIFAIINKLEQQAVLDKIIQHINITPQLTSNVLLSAQEFQYIFTKLGSHSKNQQLFGIEGNNPYFLGAAARNQAYLKGYHSYWQTTNLETIINKANFAPQSTIALTPLQIASNQPASVRTIELLLAFGANPNIQDGQMLSFAETLKIMVKHEIDWEPLTERVMYYLVTRNHERLQPDDLLEILQKFKPATLNTMITANNYLFIQRLARYENINLLQALERLVSINSQINNIFTVQTDVKQRNVLHALANNNRVVIFSKYLALKYAPLVQQQDVLGRTPLDYALMQSDSVDLLKAMLTSYRESYGQKIKVTQVLENNSKLPKEEREELQNWLATTFRQ